jgi:hypothetical protein
MTWIPGKTFLSSGSTPMAAKHEVQLTYGTIKNTIGSFGQTTFFQQVAF